MPKLTFKTFVMVATISMYGCSQSGDTFQLQERLKHLQQKVDKLENESCAPSNKVEKVTWFKPTLSNSFRFKGGLVSYGGQITEHPVTDIQHIYKHQINVAFDTGEAGVVKCWYSWRDISTYPKPLPDIPMNHVIQQFGNVTVMVSCPDDDNVTITMSQK